MDFSFLAEYYPYFLYGTIITLIISVVTIIIGTIIGILMALAKLSPIAPLRWVANIYIEIFRCTPMLIQIMIGFVLLQGTFSAPTIDIGILKLDFTRLIPGLIVISLNSGAYVAEIVRGGIQSVDAGQKEAAGSLGLKPMQAMRYVIFPQALRNILPPMGNEFIILIKDSSLLSTIGIYELMNTAQIVITNSYIPLEPYFVAAAIYFVITFSTGRLLAWWEQKMGVGYSR